MKIHKKDLVRIFIDQAITLQNPSTFKQLSHKSQALYNENYGVDPAFSSTKGNIGSENLKLKIYIYLQNSYSLFSPPLLLLLISLCFSLSSFLSLLLALISPSLPFSYSLTLFFPTFSLRFIFQTAGFLLDLFSIQDEQNIRNLDSTLNQSDIHSLIWTAIKNSQKFFHFLENKERKYTSFSFFESFPFFYFFYF